MNIRALSFWSLPPLSLSVCEHSCLLSESALVWFCPQKAHRAKVTPLLSSARHPSIRSSTPWNATKMAQVSPPHSQECLEGAGSTLPGRLCHGRGVRTAPLSWLPPPPIRVRGAGWGVLPLAGQHRCSGYKCQSEGAMSLSCYKENPIISMISTFLLVVWVSIGEVRGKKPKWQINKRGKREFVGRDLLSPLQERLCNGSSKKKRKKLHS